MGERKTRNLAPGEKDNFCVSFFQKTSFFVESMDGHTPRLVGLKNCIESSLTCKIRKTDMYITSSLI